MGRRTRARLRDRRSDCRRCSQRTRARPVSHAGGLALARGDFAAALRKCGLQAATIVAPDEGAIPRCQAVQKALGIAAGIAAAEIPYFRKHRTASGIVHSGPIGAVGRQAVIVDDILDTGGTLLSACERLRDAGVEDVSVMVTHGLFTGERWKRLSQLGVKRIFCTDSVPLPAGVAEVSIVLSVVPLLHRELAALAES